MPVPTIVGVLAMVVGILLSRTVEPGVRVDRLTLGADVPALRFLPADDGPHPNVLLAHGITASKETLFRLGEALAHAGFACYAIDLAGHGESSRPFSGEENLRAVEQAAGAIGPVSVYVGHSMGAYVGAASMRRGTLHPARFVVLGAIPGVGRDGPPTLFLFGRFDEVISPPSLPMRDRDLLVVSSWSDHALEPYDPNLVDAAVETACEGHTPSAPTAWRWRLFGLVLALGGVLGMGDGVSHRWPRLAGVLVALLALTVVALGADCWLGTAPVARRMPAWVVATAVAGLVAWGARRLHVPRWAIGAVPLICAIGCALAGARLAALMGMLAALPCLAGAVLGRVADRSGNPVQGDIAFAMFVGYALGQWMPLF